LVNIYTWKDYIITERKLDSNERQEAATFNIHTSKIRIKIHTLLTVFTHAFDQ